MLATERKDIRYSINPWMLLLIILLFQTASSMANNSPAPLAMFFKPELSLTGAQVAAVTSSMYLGCILSGFPSGWIIDIYGIKRLIILCGLIQGGGIIISGIQGSYISLLIGFFISGIGYGLVAPLTNKALVDGFYQDLRGTGIGIKQMGVTLGGAIVGIMIPKLVIYIRWNYSLITVAFLIFIFTAIGFLILPSQEIRKRETSLIEEFQVVSKFLVNKKILVIALVSLIFAGYQWSVNAFITLFFKEELLLSPLMAGLLFTIMQIAGSGGRLCWGFISDKLFPGKRVQIMAILGLIGGLSGIIIVNMTASASLSIIVFLVVLLGISSMAWNGLYLTIVTESVDKEYVGTATGFSLSLTYVGIMLMPILFGYLFDIYQSYNNAWYTLSFSIIVTAIFLLFSSNKIFNKFTRP